MLTVFGRYPSRSEWSDRTAFKIKNIILSCHHHHSHLFLALYLYTLERSTAESYFQSRFTVFGWPGDDVLTAATDTANHLSVSVQQTTPFHHIPEGFAVELSLISAFFSFRGRPLNSSCHCNATSISCGANCGALRDVLVPF